ncbi:MAG: hypothetical protein MK008_14405 [Bdellovibrionales bacterium]|nr:hypothetical protein [Bdellovibrionales bacterium]
MNTKYFITFFVSMLFAFNAHSALESKLNGEFVRISGKVTKVSPNTFILKSNSDKVIVEMDDYDWDADGYKLVTGDSVVVTGMVDNDFLENKKIEAGSVYVKNIDSYFFANNADEETTPYISIDYSVIPELPENSVAELQGVVTNIQDSEFTLNTGLRTIKVDTEGLIFNPLDNVGYTQVDINDRVRVSGVIDSGYFDTKELEASYINELN